MTPLRILLPATQSQSAVAPAVAVPPSHPPNYPSSFALPFIVERAVGFEFATRANSTRTRHRQVVLDIDFRESPHSQVIGAPAE